MFKRKVFIFALFIIIVLFGIGTVLLLTTSSKHVPFKPLAAPTLDELNTAIDEASYYYEYLYKELDAKNSVISEYYGFPLNVYYHQYNKWFLLGEIEASCHIKNFTKNKDTDSLNLPYRYKK